MDRVPVERSGPVRDLPPAISGTGREVPDLQQRRRTTALGKERQGNLLRVVGQQGDGCPGQVIARWPIIGNRHPSFSVSDSHGRRPTPAYLLAAVRLLFLPPSLP